jgi:hypothetical protein
VTIPSPGEVLAAIFTSGPRPGPAEATDGPCVVIERFEREPEAEAGL